MFEGNFLILLKFNEITIQNVTEKIKNQEIQFLLTLPNAKIDMKSCKNISFVNGIQSFQTCFLIQSDGSVDNDDFIFSSMGSPLKIEMSIEQVKEVKNFRKTMENLEKLVITSGEINLFRNAKNSIESSFLMMKIVDNMEIVINYEIEFENLPNYHSTLLFEINGFFNMSVDDNSLIEACTRFPWNQNFRAALFNLAHNPSLAPTKYFLDDTFPRDFNTSNFTKIKLEYENYQNESGIQIFHHLIVNKQKILIELKIGDKMMMTMIDSDIFNYPGVNEINFIAPLYQWNKQIIRDLFQQDACLQEEVKTSKNLFS